MGTTDLLELLLRLGAATLCGGIIGLERQVRGKPAGLRTVMLVSIGAAVMTLVAEEMISTSAREGYDSTGDMGRVLQGIVAGLGMLGAGVFLHRDTTVRLATTGASVWFAGAVGAACGLGLYLLAGVATCLAMLVLEGLGALFRRRDE
jgi:putative Mg2+ transporter-C (MgtC) family protein